MSRSPALSLSALLSGLLLLLLGACGRAPPPPDELRVAVPSLPPSLGNPFQAEGMPSAATWAAIFDGLTTLDAKGRVVPALAMGWQTTDGRTWDFSLRRDVRFSNGEPFDAQAVVALFGWLAGQAGQATFMGGRFRDVAEVKALAPDRVRIVLKQPSAILPQRLVSLLVPAPGAWARLGPEGFARKPEGTGPYRVIEIDERRRQIRLAENAHAWRKPVTPRLRIIELADEAVRQQALMSGDVDLARVGLEDRVRMREAGVRIMRAPSMQVMSIAFPVEGRSGPLADARVREALNLAVDREALARILLDGLALPASQPAARGTFGHDPTLPPIPHDPARAKALLAEAGYERGLALRAEVIVGSLPADSLIYQAAAAQLAEVGVRLELATIPFPVFLRRFLSNAWTSDAFGLSWNAAPANDVQRPMEIFSCLRRPAAFFCDLAAVPLLRAASAEIDPARREALLFRLARRTRESWPALFLVEQVDLVGVAPRVAGPVEIANRVPRYERIALRSPTLRAPGLQAASARALSPASPAAARAGFAAAKRYQWPGPAVLPIRPSQTSSGANPASTSSAAKSQVA